MLVLWDRNRRRVRAVCRPKQTNCRGLFSVRARPSSALLIAALLNASAVLASQPELCAGTGCQATIPSGSMIVASCDEVDSGAFGPVCAEAIGFTLDWSGAPACLFVIPEIALGDKQHHIDRDAAPSPRQPRPDSPAQRVAAPELPRRDQSASLLASNAWPPPGDHQPALPDLPG